MAGIVSIGAYVPMYRLSGEEIGRMWRTKGAAGEKAVAGYDEDALTMGVAAVRDCLARAGKGADALYLASTTTPYREKQNAAILASALDMHRASLTADYANSLRGATIAMRAALDAVNAASAGHVVVAAADCRMGAPGGRFEQIFGDGAAAIMIGKDDVIAEVEGTYSAFSDFTDEWRTANDLFVRSGEGRFVDEVGFLPTMKEAVTGLMEKCGVKLPDISKFVFSALDGRVHGLLAKGLGIDKSQVQDPFYSKIGNTGTPAALIMLAAALEEAKPGELILMANYGDGADAFLLRATGNKGSTTKAPSMKERLVGRRSIDYGSYLSWRDLVPFEASSLPERPEPSLASRWRERKVVDSLMGVKCRKCGTPQIHPIGQNVRICIACQAKDDFEPYPFADKTATLFTYAVDHLQPTKNPPGLNGVIDFVGGGRLICELTDYDLDKVKIGMQVEMVFRKLFQGKGIENYFGKAKPTER